MRKWIIILFFLTSCSFSNVVYESDTEINVFFCPEDMCMEKIIDLIDSSDEIKCAFYDLDLPELIEKLKEKKVEVIIEDSNALDDFITGYSPALMHNKFCVFDNNIVLTGSLNPTERGNYYNNNNIVIIKSKYLAENYLDEFEELKNNEYGSGKKVKYPMISLGNIKIESYFCPEDNCKLRVINALKAANHSIFFMTYSFTDEDIGNLLWNKNYLGVNVKGILEKKQISDYSRYDDLKEFSITDNNKYIMHHKVFVIDNKTVITGSYNPTKNANERNDENLLIIHDSKTAEKYIVEFNKLYDYKEIIPNTATDLFFSKVLYDAVGNDKNNEFIELKNIGSNTLNLAYFFISNNKTNSRLTGRIKPNETIIIKPKFSLKNTDGILLLKFAYNIIDYVAWEGLWALEAKQGHALTRVNAGVDEQSWAIN